MWLNFQALRLTHNQTKPYIYTISAGGWWGGWWWRRRRIRKNKTGEKVHTHYSIAYHITSHHIRTEKLWIAEAKQLTDEKKVKKKRENGKKKNEKYPHHSHYHYCQTTWRSFMNYYSNTWKPELLETSLFEIVSHGRESIFVKMLSIRCS